MPLKNLSKLFFVLEVFIKNVMFSMLVYAS
jgi:hypothetical protein